MTDGGNWRNQERATVASQMAMIQLADWEAADEAIRKTKPTCDVVE